MRSGYLRRAFSSSFLVLKGFDKVGLGIGEEVLEPLDSVAGRDWRFWRHRATFGSRDFGGAAIRGKASRIFAAAR